MGGHRVNGPQRSAAAERRAVEQPAAADHPLLDLQEQIGNRAMAQVLDRAQPKLMVGGSRDPEEREADQVADAVVARLGAGHGCQHETSPPVARRSIGPEGGALETADERAVAEAGRGGQQLPERTKSEMEQAFDADFGGVKVHTESTAAALAQSMSARAFTLGSHIFLGEGQQVTDRALMAHELTHTLQQDQRRSR